MCARAVSVQQNNASRLLRTLDSRTLVYSPVQQNNTSGVSKYRLRQRKLREYSPQLLRTLDSRTEVLRYKNEGFKYCQMYNIKCLLRTRGATG